MIDPLPVTAAKMSAPFRTRVPEFESVGATVSLMTVVAVTVLVSTTVVRLIVVVTCVVVVTVSVAEETVPICPEIVQSALD